MRILEEYQCLATSFESVAAGSQSNESLDNFASDAAFSSCIVKKRGFVGGRVPAARR